MGNDEATSNKEACVQRERRASPRCPVLVFASVTRGADVDAARIDDLSEQGARVRDCTGRPLAVDHVLVLEFRIPPLPELTRIEATVRWVSPNDDRSGGVAFAQALRPREAWALQQLISQWQQSG